ncbi:MAG TPA: GNAT family N-acetyltransferase [Thermoanaerobaculia bacterium]|jgi:GNAT superfamily N-acetyltransferase
MELRRAARSDAEWINAAYARVHFLPSELERDLVIVAQVDGEHAGIGRLVPAGEQAYELGGMLVFEDFRGRGVARAIIDELLRNAGEADVYCIPFADLEPVYAKAGFARRERDGALPEHIVEKLDWCEREMRRPVILMQLIRSGGAAGS